MCFCNRNPYLNDTDSKLFYFLFTFGWCLVLFLWEARWDAALPWGRLAAMALLLPAVTMWSLIVSVICLISRYFDICVF